MEAGEPREADMLETQAEAGTGGEQALLARARRRDEAAVRTSFGRTIAACSAWRARS